jgi:deoxyribodipyrimidine photo-lyase
MSSTAILWLRRDLRVHDHPALRAALERADGVVPFFCFDDRLLHGRHESGPRTQFMLECLADLREGLRERGSDLVLRHGPPERELPRVAAEVGAAAVHFTPDVSPFAAGRDGRVRRVLADGGVALHAHPGLNAVDDVTAICTNDGGPTRCSARSTGAGRSSRVERDGGEQAGVPLGARQDRLC